MHTNLLHHDSEGKEIDNPNKSSDESSNEEDLPEPEPAVINCVSNYLDPQGTKPLHRQEP